MHDRRLEDQLRMNLRGEGDSLPLTVTTAELERRLLLRRRERTNQRLTLIAAAVGVVAIGSVLAVGNGLLRLPAVGDPSEPPPTVVPSDAPASTAPSVAPTVSPAPSIPTDPLAVLPELTNDPAAFDVMRTDDAGIQGDPTTELQARYLSDSIRFSAMSAAITIVCDGPDAILRWGSTEEPTRLLDVPIACDRVPHRVDVDLTAVQPMIDYSMILDATPATAMRAMVETFGSTADAGQIAAVATLDGILLLDEGDPDSGEATGTVVPVRVGTVAPRGTYRIAVACFGVGVARWSIGTEGAADFVVRGDVDCQGGPVGMTVSEGTQPDDVPVWLTTDSANAWRIVITDPYGAQAFIAPRLILSSSASIDGVDGTGLGECVGYNGSGDSCAGPWPARDGAAVLRVPGDATIVARLEGGWTFTQARIKAGSRVEARADEFGVTEVDLGFYPDGGATLSFDLRDLAPGEWMIRVSGSADKGADTFGAWFDIPLTIIE